MLKRLTECEHFIAREIDLPQLSSQNHGAIAVHNTSEERRQRLVPVSAQYAVVARVGDAAFLPCRSVQGVMLLYGMGVSFAEQVWRRVLMVLFRETGF